IRQAKTRNINPNLLSAYTTAAGFQAMLGNDANYAFGLTPWLPSERLKDRWFGNAAEFARDFHARFGYAPDLHVAAAVAAVESLGYGGEAARAGKKEEVRGAHPKTGF